MSEMTLKPDTISNAEETAPQEFALGVLQRGFNPSEHALV